LRVMVRPAIRRQFYARYSFSAAISWPIPSHKESLVAVAEENGLRSFADGVPLETIKRSFDCGFQSLPDRWRFLEATGSRGRRAIRGKAYAINLGLLFVITADAFLRSRCAIGRPYERGRRTRLPFRAFDPVVIGSPVARVFRANSAATSAIEAVPPSLWPRNARFQSNVDTPFAGLISRTANLGSVKLVAPGGRRIAEGITIISGSSDLHLGGKRGNSCTFATHGTFFINLLFGTVEIKAKTLIPSCLLCRRGCFLS